MCPFHNEMVASDKFSSWANRAFVPGHVMQLLYFHDFTVPQPKPHFESLPSLLQIFDGIVILRCVQKNAPGVRLGSQKLEAHPLE